MKKSFLLLFLLLSSHLYCADWPNWLGPAHDGTSTESEWGNDLDNLLWKAKVGVGFSSVVVANGRLFTMGNDGQKRGGKETVYCLDAKTGKQLWTDSYEAPWSIIYMRVGHVPRPQWMEMRSLPSASTASSTPINQVAVKKYGPRI